MHIVVHAVLPAIHYLYTNLPPVPCYSCAVQTYLSDIGAQFSQPSELMFNDTSVSIVKQA